MPAANLKHRPSLFLFGLLWALVVSATLEVSQALLESLRQKYGQPAAERVQEWQKLMQTAKELPEPEKLRIVNDFFNRRLRFVDDSDLWGKLDYWATPVEFLARGAGDCEDYSIAKYFTLKELGVPEDKMRLTYVKAIRLNQAHMVLTYFAAPRAVPMVLDNLIPSIETADRRTDLLPVYSFNGIGLWLAKKRGHDRLVGNSDRLDLWSQLKQRMLEQSF
ncbi:transglutaminase-like cysteine peptidase [Methylomarinum vadi]|uniref:transglutaminase-like cysteine peptidase n=1 Tax=Methylomarinum vadi TaxID=438855 RepID=UPI0004DECDCC|nr:transglutaminase-like cysteine peptidase [Methylomarinum vadi]